METSSPARVKPPERGQIRLALIQECWHGGLVEQKQKITDAVQDASNFSPNLIVLPELTLYPYLCTKPDSQEIFTPEKLRGESYEFAFKLAKSSGANIVISFYEDAIDGKFNTAITLNPEGEILLITRKSHIPITAGYYEDKYFEKGNSDIATANIAGALIGTPTCWDQWFPELARLYGLIHTDLLVFPTAIGSEPNHPDFDTEPLWRAMMVAHGIANGMFIAAVNRFGSEDGVTFYGSSFISDPYGRTLVQAPRDESAVLVADIFLDQKRDWLDLFPFLSTRRPEFYSNLTKKGEK